MPTARELGIGFLAYSPLGHGMLTGQLKELKDVPDTDWRKAHNPRFQGENFAKACPVWAIDMFPFTLPDNPVS